MIELSHVSKSYQRPVLRDISCRFLPGRIYVIKGVSGCGKSTLFNILGGLETEYEGAYQFDGRPVKTKAVYNELRRKTGYVFQDSLLLSGLTVR